MEREATKGELGFFARMALAWRVLVDRGAAGQVRQALAKPAELPAPAVPPERQHASALALLNGLQREGRLVDFLQQDIAGFSDEEVGGAARVVHTGSRKILRQYLSIEPVLDEGEGATVTVPAGFDAQQIRLTGNVTGTPPFRGQLKHHGWKAVGIRLPELQAELDPRVLAPAEVEL